MTFLRSIPILLIIFGIFPYTDLVHAGSENQKNYKVLSTNNKKLSISNVDYFIKQGEKSIKNGNFDNAKDAFLEARKLATQLASFYSDLNTAFIGVDARIPIEMQKKGKATLKILAESNSRLAALYIRNGKPDVAVPLLIENIRIMSPNSQEGKEAYSTLIQLGFVETNFRG